MQLPNIMYDYFLNHELGLMEFPAERPDKTELRTDPDAVVRLAGYLVRQYTDKVTVKQEGKHCLVHLHFNH